MKITELTGVKANANFPSVAPGDTVKVGIKSRKAKKNVSSPSRV